MIHTISPVYDRYSNILILGSFPSVRSREEGFFYGHPQNRFWKVTAAVFETEVPHAVPEKREFLLNNHIALWDVIASCDIEGSADSSIRNVVPNDLDVILEQTDIKAVFVNGKTADRYYRKYSEAKTGRPAICLPSTSPANAAWTMDRLIQAWKVIREV